jgi:Cu(I)/Ag(I) efflux system membrane fusion protein
MKLKFIVIGLIAAGVLGAGGYGLYHLGIDHGKGMSGTNAAGAGADLDPAVKAGNVDPSTGKKVLYWHDPMVPGQKFDKPGKSPFMDMTLVPVYADGDGDPSQVAVSPRLQQRLGVRTAEVTRGMMTMRVQAAGTIAFNERDQAVVE